MRRGLRISAWIVGSLLTVIVALVAAVWIAGSTAGGRVLIERSITRFSAGHVQLSGLSGSFPAAIDLARLQLADEHGVWLTAERISLRWSPLALLARHLKVDPEVALRQANGKFERRFRRIEAIMAEEGRDPAEAGLDRLEEAWQQAKREERRHD